VVIFVFYPTGGEAFDVVWISSFTGTNDFMATFPICKKEELGNEEITADK
jgi:hypothetical protein